MDWNLGLGLLGIILSAISLVYAVYVTRKSKREKRLVFETLSPVSLAEVISRESGHSLKILYESPGQTPRSVERAVVHFLRFTNFGKVPIRHHDTTAEDRLRLEIAGGAVLDVSLTEVTRPVCKISLGSRYTADTTHQVDLSFDFLDFADGAIIQVITDSHDSQLALRGSIIGMPEGIQKAKDEEVRQSVTGWGCTVPIVFQLALLAAVPFVYRRWTGTWEHAWYLLLPLAALILPAAMFIAALTIWPPWVEFKFPKTLSPPHWYQRYQGISWELMERNRRKAQTDRAPDA